MTIEGDLHYLTNDVSNIACDMHGEELSWDTIREEIRLAVAEGLRMAQAECAR